MKKTKAMRTLYDLVGLYALYALSLCLSACSSTKYETRDPATGNVVIRFKTTGNIGIVSSQSDGSDSKAGGIPLLNGGYVNNDATTAVENVHTPDVGITFPDGTQIRGTIDHGTVVDKKGRWLWHTARSIATAFTYASGFDAYQGVQVAQEQTARGVKQAEIAARSAADARAADLATLNAQNQFALDQAKAAEAAAAGQ